MTPEKKAELQAYFSEISDREIKKNVEDFFDGRISSEVCSIRTSHLAEIAACIHTTFVALNMGSEK